MTLPPMGLAQRLMLLGMLAVVLSTTVGGLLLREQLHAVILRGMAGSLGERADRIAAGMRLDHDGTPSLDHRLVNDEFRFVFYGWYWQLEEGAPVRSGTAGWKRPPTGTSPVPTCCCSPTDRVTSCSMAWCGP